MIEVKAPNKYEKVNKRPTVFLAGSINMGKSEDWAIKVVDYLKHLDCLLLNPRREKFDIKDMQEQVEWELDGLYNADIIAFYFEPGSKSPITLYEMGLVSRNVYKMEQRGVVFCPDGFWKKENVDINANYHDFTVAKNFNDFCASIAGEISAFEIINKIFIE